MPPRDSSPTGVHESQSDSAVIPDLSEELEAWKREFGGIWKGSPGATIKEIAKATGESRRSTAALVRDGVSLGQYRRGMRRTKDVIGRTCWVPVYQIVEKETDR